MQHLAPPQYSPDGRWWWDGRSWTRVTWAVPTWGGGEWDEDAAPAEEPRRRTPAVLWVGLVALLALLLMALGASMTSWIARQGLPISGPAAPPATAAPAPTATPAPAPTATPGTANGDPGAFRQVVVADTQRFQAAAQAVSDRCSPAGLRQGTDDCRASLASLDDTVQGMQSDLAATPAPACLQPADAELQAALRQYHQGIQQELQGIDQQDLLAIAQGTGTLRDATAHAQAAGSLLQNAC